MNTSRLNENVYLTPAHDHDCNECRYCGTFTPAALSTFEDHFGHGAYIDVYVCKQKVDSPTLIYRYGAFGDYWSGGAAYELIGELPSPIRMQVFGFAIVIPTRENLPERLKRRHEAEKELYDRLADNYDPYEDEIRDAMNNHGQDA